MLNKNNQLKQRCELMLKKLSQRFLFIGLTSKVTNSAHLNLCLKANLKSHMKFYCIWTDTFLCAGWKSQSPDQQLWKNRLENNCQFFACKYSAEAKSVELCLSFPWTCKCKSLNANQCLHVELSPSWLIKTLLLWKGRTEFQCMHRWKKHLDPDLIKGYWSKEEDEKVEKLHQKCDADFA